MNRKCKKRIGNQNVLQFLLGYQNFFDQSNDEPVLYLFFFSFNIDFSKIIGSVCTNLGVDIQRPRKINLTAAILLFR